APWPLRLPQIAYLAILGIIAILVARTRETVIAKDNALSRVSLRPKLGIPQGIRMEFIAPAASAFATFSFIGFYAALLPSLLVDSLGQKSHAVAGAIVFGMFAISAVTLAAGRGVKDRARKVAGHGLLPARLALLVLGQALASMWLLLVGTALGGVACAFGYRGGLEVVNHIAPPDRRAELVSTYLVVCFTGNSLPV